LTQTIRISCYFLVDTSYGVVVPNILKGNMYRKQIYSQLSDIQRNEQEKDENCKLLSQVQTQSLTFSKF
jgi:hypothetical protein